MRRWWCHKHQERGHLLILLSSQVIRMVSHCSSNSPRCAYGLSICWIHNLPIKLYALVLLATCLQVIWKDFCRKHSPLTAVIHLLGPLGSTSLPHLVSGAGLSPHYTATWLGPSLHPRDQRQAQGPACVAHLICLLCPRQVLPVHNLLLRNKF